MSGTVGDVVQYGALGVLVLVIVGLGFGAWRAIVVVAPAARDFLVGLTAEIKANTEAIRNLEHRIDLLDAKIVCPDCDRAPCTCETRSTIPLRPAQRASR